MVHRPEYPELERPQTCPNDAVVNIHVEGGGPAVDIYHGNPIPGAENWAYGKRTHGKCEIVPGSQDGLKGVITLTQDMMGRRPVHAQFNITGFNTDEGKNYTFSVNWWGNTVDQCSHTGGVFNLPHGGSRKPFKGAGGGHDRPGQGNGLDAHEHHKESHEHPHEGHDHHGEDDGHSHEGHEGHAEGHEHPHEGHGGHRGQGPNRGHHEEGHDHPHEGHDSHRGPHRGGHGHHGKHGGRPHHGKTMGMI